MKHVLDKVKFNEIKYKFSNLYFVESVLKSFANFVSGLQLVISESSTKVFQSPIYDVKKGSTSFHIRLTEYIPLQGDIKVEFFNKPKMMRKVC